MESMALKDYAQQRGSTSSSAHIVAVGGGKGGVGKSFVSSNLALFFSNLGFKTVLIDLDLGAANAHTVLGEPQPKKTLNDFIRNPKCDLKSLAVPTRFNNLSLISGANDPLDMANMNDIERSRLMSAIYGYEADFIVLDLSAGMHSSTLDFFLMAQTKIITVTPDPSSIENAYRFMKSVFFRRIKRFEAVMGLTDEIKKLMDKADSLKITNPSDMLRELKKSVPEKAAPLIEKMQDIEFQIILNQARSARESELGYSIQSVALKYFGIPTRYIGSLDYDNAVWQSLRKRRPLVLENAYSRLYGQLLSISRDLVHAQRKKAML